MILFTCFALMLMNDTVHKIHKIESRIEGKYIAIHEYKKGSKGGKKAVLLIHGSSFPSELSYGFKMEGKSWVDVLLEDGYDVYALDFLGYGASDRYNEMLNEEEHFRIVGRAKSSSLDMKRAVEYILQKKGINKVDVIAHSWGGLVASILAESHSDKINHLILYASIGFTLNSGSIDPPKLSYIKSTPDQRVQTLNQLAPLEKRPLLASELFNEWRKKWLKSDPNSSNGMIIYPSAPRADLSDLYSGKLLFEPSKLSCRVLLVRGEYDKIPTSLDYSEFYKQLVNAKSKRISIIPNGTHVVHLERNRKDLYEEVSKFLKENDKL